MKSGFKETNSIKKQNPKDSPKDAKNTFWDCEQPQYDQRTSCFVNVGTHYGVGINQPVGHTGNPKKSSEVLPMGRVKTMRIDEAG
jgi:hypothetical protein